MLKFVNYNIVFQEVPNEVSLAINLSGCPNNCQGCHSPYLQEDIGTVLDKSSLQELLNKYQSSITCVCFMGGDNDAQSVENLSQFVKTQSDNKLKTAWYSGKPKLPEKCKLSAFDFVKLGPYMEQYGPLDVPSTNQRFYKLENGEMEDCTSLFYKH